MADLQASLMPASSRADQGADRLLPQVDVTLNGVPGTRRVSGTESVGDINAG